MGGHKRPIWFLSIWLILEAWPAFISPFLGDDAYSTMYYLSEDWSTVFLALALYAGLSYTSTILKLAAFMAVCVSSLFAIANMLIDGLIIDLMYPALHIALVMACVALSLVLVSLRFAFIPRKYVKPKHGVLYLIVRKPHSLLDLLALIYSGIGGGFVAYYNGAVWKFKQDEGKMIKTFDPQYYVGRATIDCGHPTMEMLDDLNNLVGAKWSIFNNCFTVFAGWRRKWQR